MATTAAVHSSAGKDSSLPVGNRDHSTLTLRAAVPWRTPSGHLPSPPGCERGSPVPIPQEAAHPTQSHCARRLFRNVPAAGSVTPPPLAPLIASQWFRGDVALRVAKERGITSIAVPPSTPISVTQEDCAARKAAHNAAICRTIWSPRLRDAKAAPLVVALNRCDREGARSPVREPSTTREPPGGSPQHKKNEGTRPAPVTFLSPAGRKVQRTSRSSQDLRGGGGSQHSSPSPPRGAALVNTHDDGPQAERGATSLVASATVTAMTAEQCRRHVSELLDVSFFSFLEQDLAAEASSWRQRRQHVAAAAVPITPQPTL